MEFKGKTAIVTGASVGIGRATAIKLAEEGANLAIVDMDYEKLQLVAEKIRSLGAEVLSFRCDVSEEETVRQVVETTLERFGSVEILVNNAGIWRRWQPFVETTSEMWKQYIGVNILGTMYFAHAVLPNMLKNGYGRIINVGSVAGVYGNANMADYSMTKGAVISFTKALAKEVADKGITVNCVSPGSVSNTDGTEPSELAFMGRTGSHRENAELICFLASDRAAYISCQNYQIDGCRKKM